MECFCCFIISQTNYQNIYLRFKKTTNKRLLATKKSKTDYYKKNKNRIFVISTKKSKSSFMKISLLLFTFILFFSTQVIAQLISIEPEDAHTDSDVTITFNASLGNKELEGYTGDVYTYTGVITAESTGNHDWKHVKNEWGEVNPNTLMTRIEDDLYEISFNIRDFYGIGEDEIVLKLAFLFHNEDYTKVGRTEDGGDIFVEINKKTPGSYISHQITDEKLEIIVENGLFEIQFFNSTTVKAEYIHEGTDNLDTTFTVIAEAETISPSLTETNDALIFESSKIEVYITKDPVLLHYVQAGDTILAESAGFEPRPAGGTMSFTMGENEHFYGGGSRAIPVNRRGRNLRIYNEAHYGYGNNTPTLNISIPFVVSDKGYGLFFDNRYPANLNLDSENTQRTIYNTEGGRLRYYFIAGDSFDNLLNNYTFLTGKQKMPPLWSLGYIQSKYGYQNETEARNIVNKILEEDFPLDALILDLYWFGSENDMGNLDWDYGQWPQPEQMMSDFSEKGIQTILITEPYFTLNSDNYQELADKGYFALDEAGEPYVLWGFWAGDASLLDMTQTDAQEWMWDFYQARREEGVGGWWCDLGEPEDHPHDMQHEMGSANSVHNIYSLLWAKFIDENYEQHYPGERLFNLIRSGYAGMQRYSTFPWSGDIQRSFDGLRAQIPIMLGAGMSGLGYMHSDVGGFIGNDNDGELFTRWVQFGVFAPILRMHGVGTTEPVNFSEPFKSIMRDYINLRYKMLPYNYTLAYENSIKGTPLARQLNYYEPENNALSNINDSYLWGKDFLIAPVLERSVSQRQVKFPEGKWLCYHDYEEYSGNETYTVNFNIENIPVFVRAGSFISNVRPMQSTDHYNTDSLIIQYFPDKEVQESYGYMFADDGKSTSSLDLNKFELLHFDGSYYGDEIHVDLSKTGNGYPNAPEIRNMLFKMYRISTKPASVKINGTAIPEASSQEDFVFKNPSYYWDSNKGVLYVNCSWDGTNKNIRILDAYVSTEYIADEKPDSFFLHNPWPNPFSNVVNIDADIVEPGIYSFEIRNSSGIIVKHFEKEYFEKGRKSFEINMQQNLPAGVYFLSMRGNKDVQVRKLVKYD